MSTVATLLLITLLAVCGLVMIEAVYAESIPMPSVPEFTLKLVDRSYDVPLTYTNSIDPYTGQKVTITNGGYHVKNITIDVTIRNQPFTSSNIDGNTTQLFYAIRWKGHFEDWADTYHIIGVDYNYYLNNYGISASNSEYTVKMYSMASFENVPEGGQIDFQVKAQVGYSFGYYGDHAPIMPIGTVFQSVEESVWSNTQTITLGELQTRSPEPTSPISPSPFPTDYTGVEISEAGIVIGLAIIVVIVIVGLGLLVYLMKRK